MRRFGCSYSHLLLRFLIAGFTGFRLAALRRNDFEERLFQRAVGNLKARNGWVAQKKLAQHRLNLHGANFNAAILSEDIAYLSDCRHLARPQPRDRKSTRLNSSHVAI